MKYIEYMIKKLKKNPKIEFAITVLILTCLSSIPLLCSKKLYGGHDLFFHISRIKGIVDNIKSTTIQPVYFNYLDGYGYGCGLFYPDIFLYIPALLNIIGFNINNAYKIFLILINLFSIINIYICIKGITKNKSSSYIAMLLYAGSLYRFTDMYERAALGECLAFVFLPLLILGIYNILYSKEKKGYYFTIGLCGICLSHVISFYLSCIFTSIIVLMNYKKLKEKGRLKSLIINATFSAFITSCFWMPMLEQILSQKFSFYAYSPVFENFILFYTLMFDFPVDIYFGYYFPIGIGIFYYIIPIIYRKTKKDKFTKTMLILGISSIVLCVIKPIWRIGIFYKIFSIIQFPWRLYMFATLFLIIFISTIKLDTKKKNMKKILIIYTIIMIVYNSILYTRGNKTYNFKEITNYSIAFGEYLPNNFDIGQLNAKSELEIERKKNTTILISKKEKNNVNIPLIYYKGYTAYDENNNKIEIKKSEQGLVKIDSIEKNKKVYIKYEGTNILKISRLISIASIISYIIYEKNYQKKKK